jgi:hypothetical protein
MSDQERNEENRVKGYYEETTNTNNNKSSQDEGLKDKIVGKISSIYLNPLEYLTMLGQ